MPVLELLEPDGSLSPFAPVNLLAVTMYPDQEEKREELLVTTAVQLLLSIAENRKPKKAPKKKTKTSKRVETRPSIPVPADWLRVLLRSPSAESVLEDAATFAAYSWAAGELIMFMICAAIHHPELDVTMTKAVWALPRLLGGEETYGGGSVKLSQRTLWKAWSRFKSVAHLHAVRQIWLQDRKHQTVLDLEGFVTLHNEQILEYLAMAETIRRAAIERRIIRHEETWWPPETLKLPPAQAGVPPLPATALEELARYVPEHSRDIGLE